MDVHDAARIRAVFCRLIELPPAQRPEALERECARLGRLAGRLRNLLAAHEQAGAFLADPTFKGDRDDARPHHEQGPALAIETDAPPALPGGVRIGRYRVLDLIGEGGFGSVFRAEQEEPICRTVALKLVKPGMDSAQVVARFEAERQALALMEHPNIARVYDAGATDDGRAFFVMELVDGPPITAFCDARRLSVRQRVELFVPVCLAVQHAHQKGVIHRDLKPSNILVAHGEGAAAPKIIDFGVAKAIDAPADLTHVAAALTLDSQLIGTPQYMSPEQAAGDGAAVDTRSDVYSLGVVLYELLTGQTPIDAGQMRARGYAGMLRALAEQEAARPSTRITSSPQSAGLAALRATEPRRLKRALAGELDWIVLKALEHARARRYQTVQGLADDLRRYLAGEPVLAGPPGATYQLSKFVRRHRAVLATVVAISLALAAGLGAATFGLFQARAALGRETNARRDAVERLWNSYLAQARAGRLSGRPGQRFDGLRALGEAARIRPSLELRNEAIACLSLPDLRPERTWNGAVAGAEQMAFSPSLDRYALSDARGTIHLRRTSDDHELLALPGQGVPLGWCLAFSPDGRFLADTCPGATWSVQVWDLASGRPLLQVPAPLEAEKALSFSPDGKTIALAASGGNVALYALPAGQQRALMPAGGRVERLCFDPGGTRIAVSFANGSVAVLAVPDGTRLLKLEPAPGAERLAWDPAGELLCAACRDHRVHLWDARTGQHRAALDRHLSSVINVAFSHSGRTLLSTGWDYTACLWDPRTGAPLLTSDAAGYFAQFDPTDGRLALSTGSFAMMYRLEESDECRTLSGPPSDSRGWSADISPDGQLIALASQGGVRVWDAATGRPIAHLPGRSGDMVSVAFAPDGQSLLTSGSAGVQRWPIRAALDIGPPQRLAPAGGVAGFSRDGHTAVVDMGGGQLTLLDLRHPDQPAPLGALPGAARCVAVSADGRWAAISVPRGPAFAIWDLARHAIVARLPSSSEDMSLGGVAFSPDDRRLVVGDVGSYRIVDVGTWTPRQQIARQRSQEAAMVCFSADGTLMAAVTGARHTVQLLDAATGQELATFRDPQPHLLTWLCLSANGDRLAVANEDHTITVWDLRRIRAKLAAMNLDWPTPSAAR